VVRGKFRLSGVSQPPLGQFRICSRHSVNSLMFQEEEVFVLARPKKRISSERTEIFRGEGFPVGFVDRETGSKRFTHELPLFLILPLFFYLFKDERFWTRGRVTPHPTFPPGQPHRLTRFKAASIGPLVFFRTFATNSRTGDGENIIFLHLCMSFSASKSTGRTDDFWPPR